MELKVIQTGSAGNGYILRSNSGEVLLIECGVAMSKIKEALNFDFSNVSGCIVTHSHQDHCKSMKLMMDFGIDVFALSETFEALNLSHHRGICFQTFAEDEKTLRTHQIGSFQVKPFYVKHDVPCVGFLIHHEECGTILFITDSYYCPFTFKDLNNIIIEANYSKEIVRKRFEDAETMFLKNRILSSHMSLETCCDMLQANDLSQVNNIVLIHLSDTNSNEKDFRDKVTNLTGKNVKVAKSGLEMNIDKKPF